MKHENTIAFILLGLAALSWVWAVKVQASGYNQIVKQCLTEHNYQQTSFMQFDFQGAAGCVARKASLLERVQREKRMKYNRENPLDYYPERIRVY